MKYTVNNLLKSEADFAECKEWIGPWQAKLANKGLSKDNIRLITLAWFINMKNGVDKPHVVYPTDKNGLDSSIWL